MEQKVKVQYRNEKKNRLGAPNISLFTIAVLEHIFFPVTEKSCVLDKIGIIGYQEIYSWFTHSDLSNL